MAYCQLLMPPAHNRFAMTRFLLFLILILACGGAYWFLQQPDKSADTAAEGAVFVALRGPLTISVTEAGTVQNRDEVMVKSEVEGSNAILSLIDEGVYVKAGQVVVELDASKLEDKRISKEIVLQNATAGHVRARENLEVVRSKGESDISVAVLKAQFASEDLIKYQEGEYPQELKEVQSRITIAEEELKRAQERRKWSQKLADQQFLSRAELESDLLSEKKSGLDLEIAKSRLHLLTTYTHSRKLAELKSDVVQAASALERVKRRAAADLIQSEADLKAKELQLSREQAMLDKIGEQIVKCTIRAPVSGLVVYATTGRRKGSREPLELGQPLRERQEILSLPTTADMIVTTKVHESSLDKIRVEMPVMVHVDALPGKEYRGKIAKIGLLPDAQHSWLNPDLKVYSTRVHIDEADDALRPGMSCRAEMIIKEFEDVVHIPVQCVVKLDGQTLVYVQGLTGSKPRAVKIGLDDRRMIAILDGLEAGEKVLLSPPLVESTGVSEDATPETSHEEKPVGKQVRRPAAEGEAR